MKRWRFVPLILAALIIAGCDPTNYSWSPDGRWMTVFTSDGLRLCDADGNLTPTTIPGVYAAAWFPDSKRVLVARAINVKTWTEVVKYLSPQELQDVTNTAQTARQALLTYDWNAPGANDWDKFKDFFIAEHGETEDYQRMTKVYGGAIALFLRDHEDAQLRKTIPTERQKELEPAAQAVYFLDVHSVDPISAAPSVQLMTSLPGIGGLRISPNGAAAIIVTTDGDDGSGNLSVIGTDGKHPAMDISASAAFSPDWSADGRYVVFIQTAQPLLGNSAGLGSLSRAAVIGDDGALLAKPAATEDIAGLMYDKDSRVRCLRDGRIIFASAEVTLPSTTGDMPQRPQLFSVTPGSAATVSRVLPHELVNKLGDFAQYFELSPDGQRVSIPDRSGKVYVVDLRSGEAITVQDKPVFSSAEKSENDTLYTVPQWRSNDELSLMAPSENGRPKLVLWSFAKKSTKTLSTTWPQGITDGVASTQPTTQP